MITDFLNCSLETTEEQKFFRGHFMEEYETEKQWFTDILSNHTELWETDGESSFIDEAFYSGKMVT